MPQRMPVCSASADKNSPLHAPPGRMFVAWRKEKWLMQKWLMQKWQEGTASAVSVSQP